MGGMREVYRSRDERLQRDVDIKVRREEVTADPDLQQRFALEVPPGSCAKSSQHSDGP
jgi:hypothetical protein